MWRAEGQVRRRSERCLEWHGAVSIVKYKSEDMHTGHSEGVLTKYAGCRQE